MKVEQVVRWALLPLWVVSWWTFASRHLDDGRTLAFMAIGVAGVLASSLVSLLLFQSAEYVSDDQDSITVTYRGQEERLEFAEVSWAKQTGASYGEAALVLARVPGWRLPFLVVYVPRERLRPLALAGLRILGMSKRSVERQMQLEQQGDAFFDESRSA